MAVPRQPVHKSIAARTVALVNVDEVEVRLRVKYIKRQRRHADSAGESPRAVQIVHVILDVDDAEVV
jgi:hypothetical protein